MDRGRDAEQPWQMTPLGWRETLLRVWHELLEDNVSVIAAGVAFYWLLSAFPLLWALVSIYGLTADPATVRETLLLVADVVPPDARAVLAEQLQRLTESASGALSLGVLGGILVSLGSATSGIKALMVGLNIAYDEREHRSLVQVNLVGLGLMMTGLVPALLGIGAVTMVQERVLQLILWPSVTVGLVAYLGVVYRFGPSRRPAQWSWLSPGALLATVLWVGASVLFSLYVANLGSYHETYGSLAGVVILLLWLWVSAIVILVGAQLNAELERQTAHDTTTPPDRPMGERGAYVADHLPEERLPL